MAVGPATRVLLKDEDEMDEVADEDELEEVETVVEEMVELEEDVELEELMVEEVAGKVEVTDATTEETVMVCVDLKVEVSVRVEESDCAMASRGSRSPMVKPEICISKDRGAETMTMRR